ncbi:MAG: ribbon-helix-helix domain-containing protein [Asgard group archaeon]|nr:ribbon-helix-helix domain-containing protein [Asgard group archaeon]
MYYPTIYRGTKLEIRRFISVFGEEYLQQYDTLNVEHCCRDESGLMRLLTVHVPDGFLEGLDELVRQKRYANRSEIIRIAIRDLLRDELWEQR